MIDSSNSAECVTEPEVGDAPEFLSAREAAQRMCVSRQTVTDLLNAGVIPFYPFGPKEGARRIHRSDLAAYIESRRTQKPTPANETAAPRRKSKKFAVLEPGRKVQKRARAKAKAG